MGVDLENELRMSALSRLLKLGVLKFSFLRKRKALAEFSTIRLTLLLYDKKMKLKSFKVISGEASKDFWLHKSQIFK
jgi:hypothetical protein